MTRTVLTCAASAVLIGASVLVASAQAPVEINFGVISTEASMKSSS
jgi:hypothetical protein